MPKIKTIARMRSAFPEKFGIPRQSGIVPALRACIVFEPEYRNVDALRGLEGFSHIWVLWGFSKVKQASWSPTVRPPKLGGNTRVGVFASRSPFRPNPIGLSSVAIERIEWETPEGPLIHVRGADLLDGTPIFDIKPYLPFADSHPEAVAGFAEQVEDKPLAVHIDAQWLERLPPEDETVIRALLESDPRPAYQEDAGRIYGMAYGSYEIKFRVEDDTVIVMQVQERVIP